MKKKFAQLAPEGNLARGGASVRGLQLVAVLAVSAFLVLQVGCSSSGETTAQAATAEDGVWRSIPVPEAEGRTAAVAAWTGTEAVFFAETNSRYDFAYTDGYSYDIASESWRSIPTPGWGHPGLSGAYLDGHLYLLVKGTMHMYNLDDGSFQQLPETDPMNLISIVEGDGNIWVVGFIRDSDSGQLGLGIANFDFDEWAWQYGDVYYFDDLDLSDEARATVPRYETRWSNMGIIFWDNFEQLGLIYDPDLSSWDSIDNPTVSSGTVLEQRVVLTEMGFAFILKVEGESNSVQLALLTSEGWETTTVDLPTRHHDALFGASFIDAGHHLIGWSDSLPTISLDLRDETWSVYDNEDFLNAVAVNSVWTGEHLVLWTDDGGESNSDEKVGSAVGAIWTPSVG